MSAIGFKYKPSEKARSIGGGQEVCACLSSEMHDAAVSYGINPVMSGVMMETKPAEETAQTLRKSPGGENGVVQTIGFKAGQSADGGLGDEREVSPTLSHKPSALEPTLAQDNGVKCLNPQDQQTGRVYDPNGAMTSLQAGGGVSGQRRESVLMSDSLSQMRYIVRRLTPTEAERLMGLPQEPIVEIGKMTVDEFIAHELIVGNIKADFDKGVILSCRTSHGERCEWRPLQGTSIRGYVTHKIVDGGQRRPCRAHRIVWIAAHGIPPAGMIIDHINNKKDDNRLCNLQLLTPEDNSHKAREDGLYLTGEDNPATKLTETDKNEIRRLYSLGGWSYAKLAERFNISKARIAQLIREVGYTIPVGLAPTDALIAEFQRIHDTFGAIMAEYEHRPAPKPKSANQVRAWLEKITDPATCPDSPRYKACGNGWATNQPRWILTRLLAIGEHIDPFAREEDAPCS